MKRYEPSFVDTNFGNIQSIFFAIGVVFCVAILISLFTGPIYPHQVRSSHGHWAGLSIQKGVGFSESQNIAGPVVLFFAAACIHIYRGKIWKKWILLSLFLFALLATLSRGAIVSFALALGFVYFLDSIKPLIERGTINILLLKNVGCVVSSVICTIITAILVIHWTDKSILPSIIAGFGLSQDFNVISNDASLRFGHWAWGMDVWASGNLLKMVFGGGFRSSMVAADYGAWRDAHNMYITILGDFGIVGLLLFLASLCTGFLRYVRLFLAGKAREIEKFGLLLLLALSINNITGPYFYSPICLSLLVFTFAITL